VRSTTVLPVEDGDRERAVAVQVMAFSADPVMRWLYPKASDYLSHHPGFVEVFGGLAFENESAFQAGDFGGVSLWLPPGVHVDGDAMGEFMAKTMSKELLDEAFPVLEQMDSYHIEEPHWYLPMIGVDPAQQGRGLGSALLAERVAHCDEQHLPAYLESSNPANVPLYERHGFRVLAEIQVGDSPTIFPMHREAR
jgi:GNAT superfamily N-acetyltransferase